jgi:hypothetical protein
MGLQIKHVRIALGSRVRLASAEGMDRELHGTGGPLKLTRRPSDLCKVNKQMRRIMSYPALAPLRLAQ